MYTVRLVNYILFAIAPIFSPATEPTISCNFEFDINAFTEPLIQFLTNPFIPNVEPLQPDLLEPGPFGSTPSSEVLEDFNSIQKFIFGKTDQVELRICANCQASAVIQVKSIYIEPKYFENLKVIFPQDWRMVSRFTIAHEFSHFVHEAITLRSFNGLSPQNNVPLLRKTDLMDWELMKTTYHSDPTFRFLIRGSKSHSEVDGIAIMILDKMGYEAASSAYLRIKYFSDPNISVDTETRAQSIKMAFIEKAVQNQNCISLNEDQEVAIWTEKFKAWKPLLNE